MGWWGKARYACPKGKDRITAVIEDEEKNCENDQYKWEVIDSAICGTTVYLATRRTNKETGEFTIWAEVNLTRWDPKGYFMIKCMSEDMGPYYYDCPKHILDKLTPPYNDAAREWREKCAAKREQRRKSEVRKLPIGTKIRLTNYWQAGEWIVSICTVRGRRSYIDWTHRIRFSPYRLDGYGWEVVQ